MRSSEMREEELFTDINMTKHKFSAHFQCVTHHYLVRNKSMCLAGIAIDLVQSRQ